MFRLNSSACAPGTIKIDAYARDMPQSAPPTTHCAPKPTGRPSLVTTVLRKAKETQEIVKRTMLAVQTYKSLEVLSASDLSTCMHGLEAVYKKLLGVRTTVEGSRKRVNGEQVLNTLQDASASLSSLFKSYGTDRLQDLVHICFGSAFEETILDTATNREAYRLMCDFCHPIGYKVVEWKGKRKMQKSLSEGSSLRKNRIVEDFMIAETAASLDCFDLARTTKVFQLKVKGIKFAICDKEARKTLIVSALVDDPALWCIDSQVIERRLESIRRCSGSTGESDCSMCLSRFLETLTLKDILVYNDIEICDRFTASLTQASLIKQRSISQATREFLADDLYGQRTTLLHLLVKSNEHEFQYLAYLLYDLLSSDGGTADAHEQTLLLDSLPWAGREQFQDAMRQTVKYTSSLANFDASRVPLEQQICLMKASDVVKEKAMLKLREVKAKSEDSGSKARQYLDGLLRIPFGIYREEPALCLVDKCASTIKDASVLLKNIGCPPLVDGPVDRVPTSVEVRSACTEQAAAKHHDDMTCTLVNYLLDSCAGLKRAQLADLARTINTTMKERVPGAKRIAVSGKPSGYLTERIKSAIKVLRQNPDALWAVHTALGIATSLDSPHRIAETALASARADMTLVEEFMGVVRSRLDESVHGHNKAKRQLERIVGQWVSGEQSGYCFGFEGPPGVGKTSLAKHGVARCLEDDNGRSRPFAFVAIGGSSNGSTLEGHNYTYVGSTWGRIVDVLMEKKCMNPIIFIDELDKISKTEHGRELIGILTHLVDPTQNDSFQDKYFNGVDLDLSKALFIFSYNDVDAIDRVLLDRIHRVRFEHLTLDDKLAVAHKFLFPEIYSKMGLTGMVSIPDKTLEFIIEEYTAEAGVRKLKELLFEIVGEVNLDVLSGDSPQVVPLEITTADVKDKYLKGRRPLRAQTITTGETCGVITGLWANHNGQGGILPVEARWRTGENLLDLKLTGMQGDVMKESMSVAATLACELVEGATDKARERPEGHRGIHIHVPEGATPKDGPSAGAAITTVLYSLLSKVPIRNNVAVTGEICLRGKVTAIGGLDLKIAGGLRAGITHFLFPKDNQRDFDEISLKSKDNPLFQAARFTPVDSIQEVLDAALVRE